MGPVRVPDRGERGTPLTGPGWQVQFDKTNRLKQPLRSLDGGPELLCDRSANPT